jgi:hypothetical protein
MLRLYVQKLGFKFRENRRENKKVTASGKQFNAISLSQSE